jgi:hypothetical protein
MSTPRPLTKEEKRLIVDALRAAAKEARRAKGHALADPRFVCSATVTAHMDELARRSATADRLASEISEHELRLEKVVS